MTPWFTPPPTDTMAITKVVTVADVAYHSSKQSLRAGLFEVASMVEALTRLLQTLHGAGRVHRDLKPDNVLWLLTRAQWRLLDLGICAPVGALSDFRHVRTGTVQTCLPHLPDPFSKESWSQDLPPVMGSPQAACGRYRTPADFVQRRAL